MAAHITPHQVEDVRRAAINGEYHLLLGAGASRDTQSPSGTQLPNSNQLAEALASQFNVAIEEGDLLWRVYDRACKKVGPDLLYDWLKSMFFGTSPPSWMDSYARFPWHTVWTLNIDDGFERAYGRIATEYSRSLDTRSWDDDSVSRSRDLSIVHLHGHVFSPVPRPIVFSLTEYQEAMVSRAAWPLIFRDTYGVSPFVIIGARLRDEPDIEKIVAGRAPTQAAPSFYVSPTISEGMEEDLNNWNLIPIRSTAENFLTFWTELTNIPLDVPPSRAEEVALRFGRQFRELSTSSPGKIPNRHDFIGGDEPYWPDIVSNRYAEVDWIRAGNAIARRFGKDIRPSSALLYTGRRLSGRTTGMLAIAKAFRSNAWRVFLFTADERIDRDTALKFASDGKAILLVFDGVADVAEDVEFILNRARQTGLRIACLAVDHPARGAGILGRLTQDLLVDSSIKSINRLLTRSDAGRLVNHLQTAGRLGILEEKTDINRLRHFVGHELFASLAGVESAAGFGSRVDELTADLNGGLELQLCFVAAIASKVDRTLTLVDAARMLNVDSDDLVRLVKHPAVSELVYTDGRRLLTRHRWMALKMLMQRLGDASSFDILSSAVIRLAIRANRTAHRERNATTMLVGSLMIYKNLEQIFSTERLVIWYQRLESAFGMWSGRYWEQRAILNRRLSTNDVAALASAESYAQRAVSLVQDPYSYTTLGTILVARAAVADQANIERYYDRGYDAFEESSKLDPRNIVTWIAYLQHTLGVLQRVASDPKVSEFEERIFDDWLSIYGSTYPAAVGSEATRTQLDRIRQRFDSIEHDDLFSSPLTDDGPLIGVDDVEGADDQL